MPALGGTSAPKGRVSRESETREVWRPLGSGIGLATKPRRPEIGYWRIRRWENYFLIEYRAYRREEYLRLHTVQQRSSGSSRPQAEDRPRPNMS